MVPLTPGEVLLSLNATAPGGQTAHLDRHFTVAPAWMIAPSTPTTLWKESVTPADDLLLASGDTVRITFQGSPGGHAEFTIDGVAAHLPMVEEGNPGRGIYVGSYVIGPTDHAKGVAISVQLKKQGIRHDLAKGHLDDRIRRNPSNGSCDR